MTPAEKAKDLIEKMYLADKYSKVGYMDKKIAKQCALIAVDEILKAFDDFFMIPIKEIKYWQQVKEEINNL